MRMSPFPSWMEDHLVPDELFARAYDATTPERRALIKTFIARLHTWLGQGRALARHQHTAWKQGFASVELRAPLDWTLVLLGSAEASPARVLAAALPALLAGVEDLAVVRVDADSAWPQGLLAALEIAGVEQVLDVNRTDAKSLLEACSMGSKRGALLDLSARQPLSGACFTRQWRPTSPLSMGVWLEDISVDLELLAWCQAGCEVDVWAPEPLELPQEFTYMAGSFAEFLEHGYAAVVAPAALADRAREICPLVLGPGNEGCWLWPELSLDFFQYHSVSWTDHE